jgi:hypothetical protein
VYATPEGEALSLTNSRFGIEIKKDDGWVCGRTANAVLQPLQPYVGCEPSKNAYAFFSRKTRDQAKIPIKSGGAVAVDYFEAGRMQSRPNTLAYSSPPATMSVCRLEERDAFSARGLRCSARRAIRVAVRQSAATGGQFMLLLPASLWFYAQ